MAVQNNTFIGIDIGSSSIKLIVLKRIKGVFSVEEAQVKEFEFDESTLKSKQTKDTITGYLREQLQAVSGKTKVRKVCVSVWGQSAFIRFIKLPKVEKQKLVKMVRFEAQQQVPFPIDSVIWDYQIFPQSKGGEFEVLLVAVKNKVIDFLLSSLRQTGLEIEAIDVSSLACLNAVKLLYKGENFIIVDIGAKSTDVIVQDSHKIWTRSIALGGNDITKSIMVHYNIDFKAAQELKNKEAKALATGVGKVIEEKEKSNELPGVLTPC